MRRVVSFLSIFTWLLVVGCHYETSAEMFTSTEMIRAVIFAQKSIANELKTFVKRDRERINVINRVLKTLEKDSSLSENDLLELMSSPVEVYRAVRRYQQEKLSLDQLLSNKLIYSESVRRLQNLVRLMPSHEDYIGSIRSLLRLQETYGLETKALISGQLGFGLGNASRLDVDDMFEIGRTACNKENFELCLQWLNEALHRLPKEQTPTTKVTRAALLDLLSLANFKIGKIELALEQILESLKYEPNNEKAVENARIYQEKLGLLTPKGEKGDNSNGPAMKKQKGTVDLKQQKKRVTNYHLLCRGKKVQKIKDEHLLSCDYATNGDPRLLIAPLKRETLHFDPLILLFHDVITDDEILFFKKTALAKLQRAKTRSDKSGKSNTNDSRITKTAWLANRTDEYYVRRINRRVSQITQLNLETSEDYQVANYGIGGFYAPHFDHTDVGSDDSGFDRKTGNRIATLMFYLSNIRAGGATVFPEIGLAALPKKGAAIFWFNLYKSGRGNRQLLHAACPVIYGNKWVMNKWFHMKSQELWHPCSLDPEARFSLDDLNSRTITHQRRFGRLFC